MSRNNTGNPIDSKAFADFEDNVANFDQWSISDADSFKDRKGEERLTLKGTERAGAGDTSVAVDAAARAVDAAGRAENAEAIVDAANIKAEVDRAESAADRAETASDAAFVNADVYPSVAEGRAAVADGEQFQVVEGDDIVRYRRDSSSTQSVVARYPSSKIATRAGSLQAQSKNIYNGVPALGLGLNSLNQVTLEPPRVSVVIPVVPGKLYTILRSETTPRFHIAAFEDYPVAGATAIDVPLPGTLLNNFSQLPPPSFTFRAAPSANYVVCYLDNDANYTPTRENFFIGEGSAHELKSRLSINEFAFPNNVHAKNITQGKNLFDGEWFSGQLVGTVGGTVSISSAEGKYLRMPVEPDTTYTISKGESNIFRVATWEFARNNSNMVFIDDSATEYTITTGSNVAWLGVYVTNTSAPPPFVQVERGSQKTSWETFGYKFSPVAAPYISSGGSNVPGLDVDLSGAEDATEALNYYFQQNAGGHAPLPVGNMRITGTVWVDGETLVEGKGRGTRFFMNDEFALSPVDRRGEFIYPLICTKQGADGVIFERFLLEGSKERYSNLQQVGLGAIDADNISLIGVDVEYINWFPESVLPGQIPGKGLLFLRSNGGQVKGGRYRFGGYQNVGTEDSDNISFLGVNAGVGWRTSVQFHRGSSDIRWIGGSIRQNFPSAAHSALTMHGVQENPVVGVCISSTSIFSETDVNYSTYAGGIQVPEGQTHEVSISDTKIVTNNAGISSIYFPSVSQDPMLDWKITQSRIKGLRGIMTNGASRTQLDNLTIDASIQAMMLVDSDANIGVVDYLDNETVQR